MALKRMAIVSNYEVFIIIIIFFIKTFQTIQKKSLTKKN